MFDFIPFLKPQISAVSVDDLVVLPQQLCRHCNIMDIGGGGLHRMDKTTARIHACVALHIKMLLVALFRPLHLGVSLLFRVLGRTGHADECGIHDASAPHHPARTFQAAGDRVKKQLADPMLFQQMPKMQQRRSIRHILLKKVDSHEFPHGIAVVNGVLHTLVGQAEPALQQIHPQHGLDLDGRTASFPAGIVGTIKDTHSSHGMISSMISRNSSRFVFFFRHLYSISLKLSCFMSCPPFFLILSYFLSLGGLNQWFPKYVS